MHGTFFQLVNSPNKGAFSCGLMTDYYSEAQTGRHCKVQGGNNTARLEAIRSNEISNKIVLFSKIKQRVGRIYSGHFVSLGTLVPQCKRLFSCWRWDIFYEWDQMNAEDSPAEKWGMVIFKTYAAEQACRNTDLWVSIYMWTWSY